MEELTTGIYKKLESIVARGGVITIGIAKTRKPIVIQQEQLL